MSEAYEADIETFRDRWRSRVGTIKEQEFSPSQCRNVRHRFETEILDIRASHFFASGSGIDGGMAPLKTDLEIALEEAKSRYRQNHGTWYERVLENVEIVVEFIGKKVTV